MRLIQKYILCFVESRLFIRNAEASHQGLYQCFAENTVGISHSSMVVNVDITKRDSGTYEGKYFIVI